MEHSTFLVNGSIQRFSVAENYVSIECLASPLLKETCDLSVKRI